MRYLSSSIWYTGALYDMFVVCNIYVFYKDLQLYVKPDIVCRVWYNLHDVPHNHQNSTPFTQFRYSHIN